MIDYKKELNDAQYKAVTTIDGPLLFLAGAGVGKTRTLVYRVSYLLEQGVEPESILLLTFTNKAANEMKKRIVKLIGKIGNRITACTYHSFCAMQLRKYGDLVGLTNHFSIIDSSDMEDIITMAKSELKMKYGRGFPKPDTVVNIASSMINEELSLSEVLEKNRYKQYRDFENEISLVLLKADEIKRKDHLANYDDLMVYFLKLLDEHDDVRENLAHVYQYIMIDEYQDTNNIQDKIVFKLREENHNLVVVGDDHQSLYAFRGANVKNIIAFPKRFDECQTIKLMDNYRSNQKILDVANYVIKNFATEGFKKKLNAQHDVDKKPHLVHTNNANTQANSIINIIENKHRKGLAYKDMAILHRWNFESAALEIKCNIEGIPFVKYGGKKFLDYAHVRDLLAYVKIMVNPHDEVSWFRILKVHEGIGDAYSREISGMCRDNGISALVSTKYFKRKFYQDLVELYKALEKTLDLEWQQGMTLMKDFYITAKEKDIKTMKTRESHREELLENLHKDITEDLNILVELAKEYKTADAFLDDLNLEANGKKENNDDAIIISTIHSAKGLEFDTVFILDCVDGVFPSTQEKDYGTKEDNEELRCFYVAVTRAKNDLWLFSPNILTKFGKPLYGKPSHYINGGEYLFEESEMNKLF